MTLPPPPDRWTIELANTEREEAIAAFGFTERQARFLVSAAALAASSSSASTAPSPASSTARRAPTSSGRSSSAG